MAKLNIKRFKFDKDYSFDNFFIESKALFKVCKKPKRKPDYVSYKRDTDKNKIELPFVFKEFNYEFFPNETLTLDKFKSIIEELLLDKSLFSRRDFFVGFDMDAEPYLHLLAPNIEERGLNRCVLGIIEKRDDETDLTKFVVTLKIKIKSEISSRYWYGEDSSGQYVIRESDHWGQVASCVWHRTMDYNLKGKNSFVCAKSYINIKKATS
ncbi:hypothetical protein [Riemerella anatipestifer]|uniref:Uncharacterized protein n=1 Tax=Riemerella anatipestifer TaxID=34085 RepID=A0AAP6LL70_RIEAN|nr:hypothetical protein [Riemerella anatipestifer]MCU7570491.1 hypothetical protein [Riemerella anatipestifer]MCW0507930.1 hypothetical protein [Riemerella anatipestifer]MDR7846612.1 hypothetical protein [Riemerella anatipestifer]MDY3513403.1 hypothetical protein [Riemerella anatipestifer]MDY3524966.1 hypothetical protein [Riemerella anatipestifer]